MIRILIFFLTLIACSGVANASDDELFPAWGNYTSERGDTLSGVCTYFWRPIASHFEEDHQAAMDRCLMSLESSNKGRNGFIDRNNFLAGIELRLPDSSVLRDKEGYQEYLKVTFQGEPPAKEEATAEAEISAGQLSEMNAILAGIEADVAEINTGIGSIDDNVAEINTGIGLIDARLESIEGGLDQVLKHLGLVEAPEVTMWGTVSSTFLAPTTRGR